MRLVDNILHSSCMYIMCTYMPTCKVHVCVSVCTYTCRHVYVYIHTHTYTHTLTHMYIYTHINAHTRTHTRTYTHTHTHTHRGTYLFSRAVNNTKIPLTMTMSGGDSEPNRFPNSRCIVSSLRVCVCVLCVCVLCVYVCVCVLCVYVCVCARLRILWGRKQ